MKKKYLMLAFSFLFLSFSAFAQVEGEDDDDEDYSIYDDFGAAEGTSIKRYAAPKVIGLAPAKLVSIGYDVQGPNTLTTGVGGEWPSQDPEAMDEVNFAATRGMRLFFNVPVISHTKLLINVGGNYFRTNYHLASGETATNPLSRSLVSNGLTNIGINTTIFKPLNETNFLLGFFQGEISGDYSLSDFQPFNTIRPTWVVAYGWRKHDRLQYGFGATQSYRAGEVNYFPVVVYNYTAPSKKWGIEAFLPARGHFRRTFDARNIMLAGFELEGTSYRISQRGLNPEHRFPQTLATVPDYDREAIELRRSEIRLRLVYERALTPFLWVSTQGGYIINYRYDVDSQNFFRGFFGNQPYVMQNSLSNPLYFNISLNFVSP